MKFLKQFDCPQEFNSGFNEVFMTKQPRENLDQLKKRNTTSRNRAHTEMDQQQYNGNIQYLIFRSTL